MMIHNTKKLGKRETILAYSGIDVGQEINVGPGKFGKKNKRRAVN